MAEEEKEEEKGFDEYLNEFWDFVKALVKRTIDIIFDLFVAGTVWFGTGFLHGRFGWLKFEFFNNWEVFEFCSWNDRRAMVTLVITIAVCEFVNFGYRGWRR